MKAFYGSTRTVNILGKRLIEEEHRETLAIIMNLTLDALSFVPRTFTS